MLIGLLIINLLICVCILIHNRSINDLETNLEEVENQIERIKKQ